MLTMTRMVSNAEKYEAIMFLSQGNSPFRPVLPCYRIVFMCSQLEMFRPLHHRTPLLFWNTYIRRGTMR